MTGVYVACIVAAAFLASVLTLIGRRPDERLATTTTTEHDIAEDTAEDTLDRAEPYWRDADQAIELTRPHHRYGRF